MKRVLQIIGLVLGSLLGIVLLAAVVLDLMGNVSLNNMKISPNLTPGCEPGVLSEEDFISVTRERLAERSIQFDYVNIDHGGNIELLQRPEGATDMEIYPLIWDALAEQYAGPWLFTVPTGR